MLYRRMHRHPGLALRTDLTVVKPPTTIKGTGLSTTMGATMGITADITGVTIEQ